MREHCGNPNPVQLDGQKWVAMTKSAADLLLVPLQELHDRVAMYTINAESSREAANDPAFPNLSADYMEDYRHAALAAAAISLIVGGRESGAFVETLCHANPGSICCGSIRPHEAFFRALAGLS